MNNEKHTVKTIQAMKDRGEIFTMLTAYEAIVEMGIAAVGHVGLHPQAVGALGGLKVQGKDMESARKVVREALALQEAGVFAIIFEAVPASSL